MSTQEWTFQGGFQEVSEVTAEMVVQAFDLLGLDPKIAANRSRGYSVQRWLASQAVQAGAVGLVASAVPGVHVPLIVVDLAILMHKMSYLVLA